MCIIKIGFDIYKKKSVHLAFHKELSKYPIIISSSLDVVLYNRLMVCSAVDADLKNGRRKKPLKTIKHSMVIKKSVKGAIEWCPDERNVLNI